MSYADKHQHVADCSTFSCQEPGTVLKKHHGKLSWWCPGCARALEETR